MAPDASGFCDNGVALVSDRASLHLERLDTTAAFATSPRLTSGGCTHDYNEVKALGSLNSTARTAEQTALALFYSDNFLTLWERTLRGIADANIHNIGDSARLFALANLASADAVIGAWDTKKYYNFWRPITAIRE